MILERIAMLQQTVFSRETALHDADWEYRIGAGLNKIIFSIFNALRMLLWKTYHMPK